MSKKVTEKKAAWGRAVLKRCACAHAGQDAIHGPGIRVMNICKDGYRCTVCRQVLRAGQW